MRLLRSQHFTTQVETLVVVEKHYLLQHLLCLNEGEHLLHQQVF